MRSAQRANHPRHAHTLPRAIAGLILEGRIVWQPRHRSPRGSRPDGRSYAPREEVEPKRQMTTRGYEHQRRPQAREGQSKAVWPTNWAYTPVTIRGGLCLEEQPARLRREEELLTQDEGKPRAGEGVSAETDAWTEHLVRDKRSYPPGHASLVMRTGGSGHCKQCPLGVAARPTPKRGAGAHEAVWPRPRVRTCHNLPRGADAPRKECPTKAPRPTNWSYAPRGPRDLECPTKALRPTNWSYAPQGPRDLECPTKALRPTNWSYAPATTLGGPRSGRRGDTGP